MGLPRDDLEVPEKVHLMRGKEGCMLSRNGWEAWRKLHLQYEPQLVMRGAVVMSQFTNMVTKRAKSPQETKALLLELDERARRVEEVTGDAIGNSHRMSVVMGLIDAKACG